MISIIHTNTYLQQNGHEQRAETIQVKRRRQRELVHLHWQTICMLPSTTLTISDIKPALTPEQTKSIKPKFSSFQLVPYSPTDDEVAHFEMSG